MKILLTAINAKYIHSNLAVYSLKAYADLCLQQADNIEIEIAEYTINQQPDDILMDVYKRKPDILCISCYIWNLAYVEALVREIKKICPDMPIWLGGPEVSYDARQVLERLPEVTGVMKGEGEKTFAGLLKSYTGKYKEYSRINIEGITYRNQDGTIVENSWRPVMDLSEVPFVYHEIKDFENKIIYYESSRGCPFSCSYCLSSVDKKLRFRDTELVKKELQFFIDHEVPQVKFVDRTFNCNQSHAMTIWNYIAEHDKGITNFHFEIAADLINDEELALISTMRPGLIQLEIGVQSTNKDTIREIKRTMRFDEVRDVVLRIGENGNVHQHLDLIAGLPYEDIHSFKTSFDDVYALCPEQLQLGFLKVLKGSCMEEKSEEYGLVYKSTPPYEVLFTKWISYEDILRLKSVEEMVEVYYNSRQFTHTIAELAKEFDGPFEMYDRLGVFYEENGLQKIQHKRSARYDILLEFAKACCADKADYYRELLVYDYYLRENAKTRPEFAGEYGIEKNEVKQFYENEAEKRIYLKDYEGYDKNQMRKMTHLERFELLGKTVLFDYMYRNPLNREARTEVVG